MCVYMCKYSVLLQNYQIFYPKNNFYASKNMKNQKKYTFFEKSHEKIWKYKKDAISLHPQMRNQMLTRWL